MENNEIYINNVPLYKAQLLDQLSYSQPKTKGDISSEL